VHNYRLIIQLNNNWVVTYNHDLHILIKMEEKAFMTEFSRVGLVKIYLSRCSQNLFESSGQNFAVSVLIQI